MKTLSIKSIKKIKESNKRYDLTIKDNHNFFANGILVHNCSIYHNGYFHARSIDGNGHSSQDWLKKYIQSWCYLIPTNWRVCGENLFAKHSIQYEFKNEKELFQVFGVYDNQNNCLSWDDVVNFCKEMNILTVPIIYIGKYDKDKILEAFNLYQKNAEECGQEVEGFVVRNFEKFSYDSFSQNVGKFVRNGHVQTDQHWRTNWIKNKILKEK